MNSLIEAYQSNFSGTRIATLGFAMATASLRLEPSGIGVVERPAYGIRPGPRAGCSQNYRLDLVRSKDSHKGDLTMQNGALSRHATLYAVVILGLSIVATTLAFLALLFF
jgi:hypothetical protein